MIERRKVRKENGKEIGKEKKEITSSRDKVVPDYNRDDKWDSYWPSRAGIGFDVQRHVQYERA